MSFIHILEKNRVFILNWDNPSNRQVTLTIMSQCDVWVTKNISRISIFSVIGHVNTVNFLFILLYFYLSFTHLHYKIGFDFDI